MDRPTDSIIFANAVRKFESSLTTKLKTEFSKCTLKDVEMAIADIQARYGARKQLRGMQRLSKFLEAMNQLGQVVEIFLNANEFVAFIWGPIKFALVTASSWIESLEILIDTYVDIGEVLPGLKTYEILFQNHPCIRDALERYFCDVIEFHVCATSVFTRSKWKTLFHSSWKTFKTQFSPILNNLKRHRDLLSDEKSTALLEEIRANREDVETHFNILQKRLDNVQAEEARGKEMQERQRLQKERIHICERLDAPDYENDLSDARSRRHNLSGTWIFEEKVFKEFIDMSSVSNKVLYLHGSPGFGKTTLVSYIIDHLVEARRNVSDAGDGFSLVYFFFRHEFADKNSLASVLSALLDQLVRQDSTVMHFLEEKSHAENFPEKRSIESLKDTAKFALLGQRRCFVLLDGLDECSTSENKTKEGDIVLEWFEQLLAQGTKPNEDVSSSLHLLISGQRDVYLADRLQRYPSIQIETSRGHNHDVQQYVNQKTEEIDQNFSIGPEIRQKIINDVTDTAQGMFLYARVVLENLLSQVSKAGLKRELKKENFPSGLEQAYERVVVRVFENPIPVQREIATKIIGWITCATRPLKWREIQARICVDVDQETSDPDELLRISCKQLCGSLADIFHPDGRRVDDYEASVRLVHRTAREYLISTGRLCLVDIHSEMALFCCKYLGSAPFRLIASEDNMNSWAISGYYAFHDYAFMAWWDHVCASHNICKDSPGNWNLQVIHSALRFIIGCSPGWGGFRNHAEISTLSLEESLNLLESVPNDPRERSQEFMLEQRASHIRESIKSLSLGRTDPDVQKLYGPTQNKCTKPWCVAFARSFSSYSELEQHVQCHERPFRCSNLGCHGNDIGFSNLEALETHNKNFHVQESKPIDWFPISSIKGSDHRQALFAAAAKGDIDEIKACLSHGIDPDVTSRDQGGTTPLMIATAKGHVQACRYLINSGALVTFQGSKHSPQRTALHIAIEHDHLDLLHFYLSHTHKRAEIRDKDQNSLLHAATASGLVRIVEALISAYHFNPYDQDRLGRNALDIAVEYGHTSTVKFLYGLMGPESVHQLNGRQQTLLNRHPWRSVEVAQLLLEWGIDVRKPDREGETPLQRLCGRIYYDNPHLVDFLKVLITSVPSSDMKAVSKRGTLLHNLLQKTFGERAKIRTTEMTRILLEAGDAHFLANEKDSRGRLPLHFCCIYNNCEAIGPLIPVTRDINQKDENGRSPALLAAKKGFNESLSQLLDTGAIDLHTEDDNGQSLLYHACSRCNLALIKRLIDMDSTVIESCGGTSLLHIAVARVIPNLAIVEWLLAHPQFSDPNLRIVTESQPAGATALEVAIQKSAISSQFDSFAAESERAEIVGAIMRSLQLKNRST